MIKANESLCSGCGACVSVCSQLAIYLMKGKVQIDYQRCDGCGDLADPQKMLCIEACPNHALLWTVESTDKSTTTILPVEQLPISAVRILQKEDRQLEPRQLGVMPTLGIALKQVGEELIKELPYILASIADNASRKEGRRCSPLGRQQPLQRRRRQRWRK